MKSFYNKIPVATIVCIIVLVSATTYFQKIKTVQAALGPDTPTNYAVLSPLPCIESATVKCQNGNGQLQPVVGFKDYVQYTFNLLIALAAVAAVFMIVWGGLTYMTSDAIQGKTEGRKKLTNAIYGLLLVLCSYLLLRTIDPRLVNIPNTFVPQLKLANIKSGELNDFLTEIERRQQQQDNASLRQTALDINSAKASMADSQKQWDDLGCTQRYEDLEQATANQCQGIQDKINQQKSDLVLKTNMSLMQQTLYLGLNADETFDQAVDKVNKTYEESFALLQPLGTQESGTSNSAQKLLDQKNYTLGLLQIQNDCQTHPTGAAAQTALNSWKSRADQVKDPALNSKLIAYQKQAISSECTVFTAPPTQ